MEIDQIHLAVVTGGIILGTLFGFTSQSTRFCTLGAISDFLLYKNSTRAKMWLTALLGATITTQILIYINVINPVPQPTSKILFDFLQDTQLPNSTPSVPTFIADFSCIILNFLNLKTGILVLKTVY